MSVPAWLTVVRRSAQGLGMHHLSKRALALFREVIQDTQRAYPEIVKCVYIVNAPWTFTVAWRIVSCCVRCHAAACVLQPRSHRAPLHHITLPGS